MDQSSWLYIPNSLCVQAVLERCLQQQDMLGVPDCLRYHQGWKKWRLDVGGSTHSFREKANAMEAARWSIETRNALQVKTAKD